MVNQNIMSKFLVFFTLFFSPFCLLAQDSSKGLLVEAIKSSNKLENNLSIEQRIETYEDIQSYVDAIINDFPSSDEAIKLVSGEDIGNFRYNKLKESYFSELTSYYNKVCKLSPSLSCIAAVSLDSGNKSCMSADNFSKLELAHANIANSIRILNSQNSDQSLINAGHAAYRGCIASSKIKSTQLLRDYFDAELIDLFLQTNDENQARAIIQRVSDPYLKFSGVLSLQNYLDKVDKAYVARMREYINNRIPSEYASIASARLLLEELKQTKYRLKENDLKISFDAGNDPTSVELAFSLAVEIINETFKRLDKPELKSTKTKLRTSASKSIFTSLKYSRYKKAQEADAALGIYTILKQFNDADAQEFLLFARSSSFDIDSMMEYVFQLQNRKPEYDVRFISSSIFNDFYEVKQLVRNDKICEAVDRIFNDFSGTSDFQKSISYLISSPSIDANKSYQCGDVGLELLLQ